MEKFHSRIIINSRKSGWTFYNFPIITYLKLNDVLTAKLLTAILTSWHLPDKVCCWQSELGLQALDKRLGILVLGSEDEAFLWEADQPDGLHLEDVASWGRPRHHNRVSWSAGGWRGLQKHSQISESKKSNVSVVAGTGIRHSLAAGILFFSARIWSNKSFIQYQRRISKSV